MRIVFYKFDNATGQVGNRLVLPIIQSYVNEFSIDSRFYYTAKKEGGFWKVLQYDLSTWDAASVLNSEVVIDSSRDAIRGMQMGPDRKIYILI